MSTTLIRYSALTMVLVACGGEPAKSDGSSAPEAKKSSAPTRASGSANASASAATPTTTASAATAPSADAPPALSGSAVPVTLPGRSAVPTVAEWDGVKEVGVKGSGALGCETKMVREWLRISCRGKNDTGGTPTALKYVRGDKREALVFTGAGVTSLVVPYVDGTDLEYTFSWTDKSHKLVLIWPKGSPKPQILGVFEGAASPLDGTVVPKSACETDIYNADCERTYKGSCQNIIECSRGEPAMTPSCLPTHRLGPMNTCYKLCKAPSDCATGESCDDSWGGAAVCK